MGSSSSWRRCVFGLSEAVVGDLHTCRCSLRARSPMSGQPRSARCPRRRSRTRGCICSHCPSRRGGRGHGHSGFPLYLCDPFLTCHLESAGLCERSAQLLAHCVTLVLRRCGLRFNAANAGGDRLQRGDRLALLAQLGLALADCEFCFTRSACNASQKHAQQG
jgi:hypothetical protein